MSNTPTPRPASGETVGSSRLEPAAAGRPPAPLVAAPAESRGRRPGGWMEGDSGGSDDEDDRRPSEQSGALRAREASVAARHILAMKAEMKQRESELAASMEDQERKLAAASRALGKSRAQVQRLTAQVGLKDLQTARLEAQVSQLRNLLVEKETRLQEALDSVDRLQEAAQKPARPRAASGGSSGSLAGRAAPCAPGKARLL